MDYYLIQTNADAAAFLAEEFVRRNDFSTSGLRSSDGSLSRIIRTDPSLNVVAVTRDQTSGPVLLRDYEEFPSASLLTLSQSESMPGFREKRLYRVLFARTPAGGPAENGDVVEAGDRYNWLLRTIGHSVAWCLDLTAHLNEGTTLGTVLDRLTDQMRLHHGLIPVTTERFQ